MLSTARPWIILPLVALFLAVVIGRSWGDKPVQVGNVVLNDGQPPENLPQVEDRPSTEAQQKIRKALEGESDDTNSGNGVLNDVLDVIKQRGSILAGSSLDDRATPPRHTEDSASRKALVAEQLLKASRLLRSLGDPDKNRSTLIDQMRREAKKLLSE